MMGFSNAPLPSGIPDRHYASGHPSSHHPHSSHYYSHFVSHPPPHSTTPVSENTPRRLSDLAPSSAGLYPHSHPSTPSSHHHPPPNYASQPLSPRQYSRYDHTPMPAPYEQQSLSAAMSSSSIAPGPIPARVNMQSPRSMQGPGLIPAPALSMPPGPHIKSEPPSHPQSPFRFQTTLETPTSMIQRDDEIPITYLNKSQKYRIIVCDSQSRTIQPPGSKVQYRTSIRVTFDDAGQRREPAAAWELWKETRDTRTDDESRYSSGQLRALEFIDEGDRRRPFGTEVQLERHSFDSFSVIWSPASLENAQCAINARFNFLSTDFSQTKGVKGVAVRVVAKTSLYSNPNANTPNNNTFSELSYCKAKVFRDHGAERKLAIDSDRVRRSIEKIRHTLRGSERGMAPKRKDRITKRPRNAARSRLLQRNIMDRSMDDEKFEVDDDMDRNDDDIGYVSPTESLQIQLRSLEQMSRSTSSCTVFVLPGEEGDDPDLFPVKLYEDRHERPHGSVSDISRQHHHSWPASERTGSISDSQSRAPLGHPPSMTISPTNAVDVDHTYRPPVAAASHAIACFYLRRQTPTTHSAQQLPRVRLTPEDTLFRATYLMKRTASELCQRIGAKWKVDTSTSRLVHVNANSIEVCVDDDFVQQMPEGQAYDMELLKVASPRLPPALPSVSALASVTGSLSLPSILNDTHSSPRQQRDTIYEIRLVPVSP
ncbi:transcription factor CP2 and like protein [Ceratocystis lukuohia]|uniref:Transcription factor CP2 and like protein n=1 Tax=Ceratocystis lukuohia TaxID=2019550 RepID=A0ABR4MNP4_9PEZI